LRIVSEASSLARRRINHAGIVVLDVADSHADGPASHLFSRVRREHGPELVASAGSSLGGPYRPTHLGFICSLLWLFPRSPRKPIDLAIRSYHPKALHTQCLKPPAATSNVATRSGEIVEKRLRLLEICGIEAFGEPAVDRPEQVTRLILPLLRAQEMSETDCRAQFEPAAPLLSRNP